MVENGNSPSVHDVRSFKCYFRRAANEAAVVRGYKDDEGGRTEVMRGECEILPLIRSSVPSISKRGVRGVDLRDNNGADWSERRGKGKG